MRLGYILRIGEVGLLTAFVAYDIPSHYAYSITHPSQLSNRILRNPFDNRGHSVYIGCHDEILEAGVGVYPRPSVVHLRNLGGHLRLVSWVQRHYRQSTVATNDAGRDIYWCGIWIAHCPTYQ